MSGNEKFEREFDDFLTGEDSRLAELYRRLPRHEPDARLDAAVHAMAHGALGPELAAAAQGTVRRRYRMRWISAVGAAAGIVLAAGIAFRMGPSTNGPGTGVSAPANDAISVRSLDRAAQPESSLPAPPTGQARANAPTAAVAPVAGSEPVREEPRNQNVHSARAPSGTLSARPGAPSKPEGTAGAKPAPQAFPAGTERQREASSDAATAKVRQTLVPGAMRNLHDRAIGEAEATGARKQKSADRSSADAMEKRSETRMKASPAPARGTGPASLPQPPPQALPAPTSESASQAADSARRDENRTPAAAGALKKKRLQSNDSNASLYPEHWLANIRTMLKEGQRAEALRSLAEFRRTYPDYRLPDDLRDLK